MLTLHSHIGSFRLTAAAQIAEMYQRQVLAQTKGGKKGKGGGEDDFW